MVDLNPANVAHLLRRTEYVARPARVQALMAKASIELAVDDILAVPGNPGSVSFATVDEIQRGDELTHFWLDRMAHDSPRPIQEKMGFFWHGHFCSDLHKVRSGALMRQQIDFFRRHALSDLGYLATTMSTQVAMLRYLDNNQNKRTSPNQNFARELMELFILGVGNYTEDDVEAATAAWTGHTDNPETGGYVWRPDWHDASKKRFLVRDINDGGDPLRHGAETIEVMLGADAKVPAGADVVANRGRPTQQVAAEFISRKLWTEFAGTEPSPVVLGALRDVALANDFQIKPWLKALLTREEFYDPAVKRGLVRSPVEYIVAVLAATGRRSLGTAPLWRMEGMGQRPLYPPNVSGWKHNSYWINAAAMSKRTEAALIAAREITAGGGAYAFAGGEIVAEEVRTGAAATVLDTLLTLMQLTVSSPSYSEVSPESYDVLLSFAEQATPDDRVDLIHLIMLTHDFHLA